MAVPSQIFSGSVFPLRNRLQLIICSLHPTISVYVLGLFIVLVLHWYLVHLSLASILLQLHSPASYLSADRCGWVTSPAIPTHSIRYADILLQTPLQSRIPTEGSLKKWRMAVLGWRVFAASLILQKMWWLNITIQPMTKYPNWPVALILHY